MSDIELDARAVSSTGLEPPFAAALSYLAGPLSGIILLLAERTNRFVRFHAWQAVIGLGGLGILAILLLLSAFLSLFVSPVAFRTLSLLAAFTGVMWVVLWGVCIVWAVGGSVLRLPLAGRLAEKRALR